MGTATNRLRPRPWSALTVEAGATLLRPATVERDRPADASSLPMKTHPVGVIDPQGIP